MMHGRRAFAVACASLFAGCASYPRHDMRLALALDAHPVRSVLVLPPTFPKKVKRNEPEDLPEMLPDRTAGSATAVLEAVRAVLSASTTVDAANPLPPAATAWAAGIQRDLDKGIVPLRVPPAEVPAESVLFLAMHWYGAELNQWSITPLPFLPWSKRYFLGPRNYDHVCDFSALLVNPKNGDILFDGRHGEVVAAPAVSGTALAEATRAAAGGLLKGFR
ncbi:MAG: hypothetical protein AAB368_09955 [bacterium]|mgnify:CR=1 FL=1